MNNTLMIEKNSSEYGRRGFDALKNKFYVYCFPNSEIVFFDTFEEYFEFLDGDIYENCCYAFYDFSKDTDYINREGINVSELKKHLSFIDNRLEDVTISSIKKDKLEAYENREQKKETISYWKSLFLGCFSAEELVELFNKFDACEDFEEYQKPSYLELFLLGFLLEDCNSDERLEVVLDFCEYYKKFLLEIL